MTNSQKTEIRKAAENLIKLNRKYSITYFYLKYEYELFDYRVYRQNRNEIERMNEKFSNAILKMIKLFMTVDDEKVRDEIFNILLYVLSNEDLIEFNGSSLITTPVININCSLIRKYDYMIGYKYFDTVRKTHHMRKFFNMFLVKYELGEMSHEKYIPKSINQNSVINDSIKNDILKNISPERFSIYSKEGNPFYYNNFLYGVNVL